MCIRVVWQNNRNVDYILDLVTQTNSTNNKHLVTKSILCDGRIILFVRVSFEPIYVFHVSSGVDRNGNWGAVLWWHGFLKCTQWGVKTLLGNTVIVVWVVSLGLSGNRWCPLMTKLQDSNQPQATLGTPLLASTAWLPIDFNLNESSFVYIDENTGDTIFICVTRQACVVITGQLLFQTATSRSCGLREVRVSAAVVWEVVL